MKGLGRAACLSRKKSLAAFALGAATLWAIAGLLVRQAYVDGVSSAFATTANLARSLAEHEAASVRAIDLSLLYLREEWLRDRRSFAAAVSRHEKQLGRERVIQVAVLDAEGTILFSRLPVRERTSFADRAYFRVQRERGTDQIEISEPVFGRVTNQWAIQFTRPMLRDDRFDGLMIVAVPPPALEKVYRDIDLGRGGVITLVRGDGKVLARSDNLARGIEVSLAGEPGIGAAQPASGSYRGTSRVDGTPRFYSYRRLEAYPLVVRVGQSVESALAPYRRQRDVMVGGAAIATLLVYVMLCLSDSRAREREQRERLEEALVEGERKLLDERERMMLELHDGSIQSLYAIGLQIENCRRLIDRDPAAAARAAAEIPPRLNGVIHDLRALLAGDEALGRSRQALTDELAHLLPASSASGPRFAIDIEPQAARALSAEQASHVLRVAGEAASNVVRHANAKTASISLTLRDGVVCLAIADDGIGLDARRSAGEGLGLRHIRARAAKLGATLRTDSAPGRGTRIALEFAASRASPSRT